MIHIGKIKSYYGGLCAYEIDGKFYWGIEDWKEMELEEIPESLYNELIKFENSRKIIEELTNETKNSDSAS